MICRAGDERGEKSMERARGESNYWWHGVALANATNRKSRGLLEKAIVFFARQTLIERAWNLKTIHRVCIVYLICKMGLHLQVLELIYIYDAESLIVCRPEMANGKRQLSTSACV